MPEKKVKKPFPVVAIGASAGGLEAVTELLKSLNPDTGMAFIFIQHLNPNHKSILPEILSRLTIMKVQEIEDMELMEPDNIYVIPHNKGIRVTDGHIQLIPRKKNPANLSIDVLFSSLALTHKSNVVGIILSGNANDGTAGTKAIHDAGGITYAQDNSAKYLSMPHSAIAGGGVDFVFSPEKIGTELNTINKNGFAKHTARKKSKNSIADDDVDLKGIFEILHKATKVDFSHYKTATIKRRLSQRMNHLGILKVKDYSKYLLKKNNEVGLLYKDFLINVTAFFRDTETFNYLQTVFFPKLIKSKSPNEGIRIWIAACSTGEEAYSMAMLIAELQENKARKIPVQIFASDLSEQAIRTARIGEYAKKNIKLMPKKRVERFFNQLGDTYHIVKEIREMCVFAPHNVLSDPPFSRIDFVSCRNLLIYFGTAAQKKVISTFHFALNDTGYLMLGKSEAIGSTQQLFIQVNEKFKIYSRKKDVGVRKLPELQPQFPRTPFQTTARAKIKKNNVINPVNLDSAIDAILLSRYMPACAIINKDMEILQFRGSTGLYLRHQSGKASLNILKLTRPECAFELRNAIHQAFKTKETINKSGIEIQTETGVTLVSIEVSQLSIQLEEPVLLIVFSLEPHIEHPEESAGKKKNAGSVQSKLKDQKIKKLAAELAAVRDEMHQYIEAQEIANEELQTANEEITSANEEFQTLSEELETSKEEIEASNEELIVTNQELNTRNEQLAESNNYAEAIIATIHEPMLILDKNLCIKSGNGSFYKKFKVNEQETEGVSLFKLGNGQWNILELRQLLEDIRTKNTSFNNFEVVHTFPHIGKKVMMLNASQIVQKFHHDQLILLAIEDITIIKRKQTEEKELLRKDIRHHKADNLELEMAVKRRTKQLVYNNAALEKANKELESFNYVASHDLQEPLRKIQNFADLVLKEEKKNLSVTGKGYFQRMQETALRMQMLIEDLLAYSRSRNLDHNFEKTDLVQVVADVKKDFAEALQAARAIVEMGETPCEMNVIGFQLRQLFHNLFSNAIKFSAKKRALRVKIECAIAKGSKLKHDGLTPHLKYCHITFEDNGIGFDPQYKDRIFEVFQRLHSSDDFKGTGIGLAICKRIVDNHNGIITATGKLNAGVRFDIYIPAV
ncbi:MAG: ATP-binding protein [Bacteroidota bacterium]|nr:ATP-binding protein [Bacteroidota bacterium]